MSAAILPASLAIPRPTNRSLSSLRILTLSSHFHPQTLSLSIDRTIFPSTLPPIRMGGGPRTYPGGVSKWQWKRMQEKKAKQLLKARLCRERQIYEMRKRTELKAAVSELEKPWEIVERAPTLFSVSADEQVKALADRFQRPGGFDMWSERDGPQIFRSPDGLPSARFFPKGVVHSVKPYGVIAENKEEMRFDDWIARGGGGTRRRRLRRNSDGESRGGSDFIDVEARNLGDGSDQVGNLEENMRFPKRFEDEEGNAAVEAVVRDSFEVGRDGRDSHCGSSRSRRFNGRQAVKGSDHVGKFTQLGSMEGRRDSYEGRESRASSSGWDRGNGRKTFDSNAAATGHGGNGRIVGRGNYRRSDRRPKGEKISLRPTSDLYSEEGSNNRMRNSKRSKVSGLRSDHVRRP